MSLGKCQGEIVVPDKYCWKKSIHTHNWIARCLRATSVKSCDPGWISTFIFGVNMGPTWVFFFFSFFLSCSSSFQALKCMYCIHFRFFLVQATAVVLFLSGAVGHVESNQGALSCTFIASSTILSHRWEGCSRAKASGLDDDRRSQPAKTISHLQNSTRVLWI